MACVKIVSGINVSSITTVTTMIIAMPLSSRDGLDAGGGVGGRRTMVSIVAQVFGL
jgi:hypothetical protein